MKDRPTCFQPATQLKRVGQIPVVCQRQMPFSVVDDKRLDIPFTVRSGRGIPNMTHTDPARSERTEFIPMENFTDQPGAFSDGENPVIVENNTCAFLSAMLQCIQSIINQAGDRHRIRGPDTEYTAFLMKMSCFHHS